jgi:phosphoglycerate dehydrogenase-like enzyme
VPALRIAKSGVRRGAVVYQGGLMAARDADPLDYATRDVSGPEPPPEGLPF